MNNQTQDTVIPAYQTFRDMTGQIVNVTDTQANSIELTINEVVPSSAHGQNYQSFTIGLSDIIPNRLLQGCYTFSHPEIGKQWLFCTAISATQYEIVINRDIETKK